MKYKSCIELQLKKYLPDENNTLHQAMRYSVLNGGKRFRPFLVYATGVCFGANIKALHIPAVAVELIHAYSLIHDDLPAMDNDDLRRGKPSCHKAFDEATAILAGDALQNLAFEILSKPNALYSAEKQLRMIQLLSEASGSKGMVGGQMLDMKNERKKLNPDDVEKMHSLKTGRLIRASVLLSAIVSNCNQATFNLLHEFSDKIGLAFQINDDILDNESNTATLGKTAGLDKINRKANAITTLGLNHAKERHHELMQEALLVLNKLPQNTFPLESMLNEH